MIRCVRIVVAKRKVTSGHDITAQSKATLGVAMIVNLVGAALTYQPGRKLDLAHRLSSKTTEVPIPVEKVDKPRPVFFQLNLTPVLRLKQCVAMLS